MKNEKEHAHYRKNPVVNERRVEMMQKSPKEEHTVHSEENMNCV